MPPERRTRLAEFGGLCEPRGGTTSTGRPFTQRRLFGGDGRACDQAEDWGDDCARGLLRGPTPVLEAAPPDSI